MSQPEYRIVRAIQKWLTEQGIFHFKIHGSALMRVGLPDLVCCVEGMFLGLEVKQPGEKAKPTQERVGQEIKWSEGQWFVVSSLEEAQAAVHEVRRWVIRRA
jgi:Holliday junction resolvase